MKTITRYKFRYSTQKREHHNIMQIHKACANRQKQLYIDQCFRSLLDLRHESNLIKEKVNIINNNNNNRNVLGAHLKNLNALTINNNNNNSSKLVITTLIKN